MQDVQSTNSTFSLCMEEILLATFLVNLACRLADRRMKRSTHLALQRRFAFDSTRSTAGFALRLCFLNPTCKVRKVCSRVVAERVFVANLSTSRQGYSGSVVRCKLANLLQKDICDGCTATSQTSIELPPECVYYVQRRHSDQHWKDVNVTYLCTLGAACSRTTVGSGSWSLASKSTVHPG